MIYCFGLLVLFLGKLIFFMNKKKKDNINENRQGGRGGDVTYWGLELGQ